MKRGTIRHFAFRYRCPLCGETGMYDTIYQSNAEGKLHLKREHQKDVTLKYDILMMPNLHHDKHWLTLQYHGFEKSTKQIADLCGVCQSVLYKSMIKLEIPLRSYEEAQTINQKHLKKHLTNIWTDEKKANHSQTLRDAWTPEKREKASCTSTQIHFFKRNDAEVEKRNELNQNMPRSLQFEDLSYKQDSTYQNLIRKIITPKPKPKRR